MDTERPDGFSREDPLWDLLEHASKPPAPSPYFARRVLRDLDTATPAASAWGWLKRFRLAQALVPVAAAVALVAAAGHFWLPGPSFPAGSLAEVVDDGQQRVSAVLADLDDLVAVEDNQLTDDDSAWQ